MLSRVVKTALFCICTGAIGVSLWLWHWHSTPMQRGVLATVNGQPITVQRVQLQVDLRHPPGPETTFESMRAAHMQALGSLIVTRLMEQELRAGDLLPDERQLEEASKKLLRDYPPDEVGQALDDAGLSEADWLAFMRDTQIAGIFEEAVLRNRLHIDLASVRDYYASHRAQFALPDSFQLCSVRSTDRAEVEQACARLGKNSSMDGTALQNLHPTCTTVRRDELPDALHALAKRDRLDTCSRIEQLDDYWQAAWLTAPQKGGTLPLVEAYVLIETLLRDSGKYATFGAWLQQAMARADIRLASEVVPEMLNLQTAEKRLSSPVTEKPNAKQGK